MDDTSRRLNDEGDTGRTALHDSDLDEESARKAREIRSEIAQTRDDMSETIDAIQEKLRPGNIAAAATDRVRDAATSAARNVADSASHTARHTLESTRRIADDLAEDGRMTTIAGTMIAIGSAWLLFDRWRSSRRPRTTWRSGSGAYGSAYRSDYGNEPYRTRWTRESAADEYDTEGSDEGVFTEGYERASAMAHDVRERAAETTYRARNAFSELLESNPLMVGAAAVAIGATVGLAFPETERENEWMGDTKETVFERAQDVARSTVTQVRQAAGDIAGQVANEVVSGDRTE
jgi:Protein of unknown function (DUF3618)